MTSMTEILQALRGDLEANRPKLQLRQAQTLVEIAGTLSPEPLEGEEQIRAFYRGDLNVVRGRDIVVRMTQSLRNSFDGLHYKSFLLGHSGVGKSTEINRLLLQVGNQFLPIRFSARRDLTLNSFKPTDIPLLMMIMVTAETYRVTGNSPPAGLLENIFDWFSKDATTRTDLSHAELGAGAGIGLPSDSILAKTLGLFLNLKGELKYSSDRNTKTTEYRLNRLSDLISLVNRLVSECNRLLREREGKEWLFIGEDFDKGYIPPALIEDLFINYSSIFEDTQAHLLFDLPLALHYSGKSPQLPRMKDGRNIVPDTPLFHPDHTPDNEGRAAVRNIVTARVNPILFEEGQLDRLIVASGGNLRALFRLITEAGLDASVKSPATGRIAEKECTDAINQLRAQYEGQLGQGPFDTNPIPYDEKAKRLVSIYRREPKANVLDNILHTLLNTGVVQEFNGEHWLGVHPLVVDILVKQKELPTKRGIPAPGGTR